MKSPSALPTRRGTGQQRSLRGESCTADTEQVVVHTHTGSALYWTLWVAAVFTQIQTIQW